MATIGPFTFTFPINLHDTYFVLNTTQTPDLIITGGTISGRVKVKPIEIYEFAIE